MTDLKQIQETLAQVQATLNALKAQVDGISPSPSNTPEGSFESLKALLDSDKWPVAANPNLICDPDNEVDKIERGRGIVELMVETDLKDKKFLDYGCGEGHSTAYASTKGVTKAVGYDVLPQKWDGRNTDTLLLTSNWEDVVTNGPYDAILVFDVIDHLTSEKAADVVKKIRTVLKDEGEIFLRAHPFTSRHALHNYHDLNKGFIQLVFTPEELDTLLKNSKHIEQNSGRVVTPLAAYKKFFDEANLEIISARPVKDVIDPFFKLPTIESRIKKTVGMEQFPEFQMGMQFIDYRLRKIKLTALSS
jgi:SAM-dependent methyltransferase